VKIHHLGIVVTDVAETLQALGLDETAIREVVYDPIQKNKLHFIYLKENDLWIELVEPTNETASTHKFAKKFGMGLHHLGMGSDNLELSEKKYENQKGAFSLGRYQIEVNSFGGKIRTLFIAIKGLIIEFVKVEKD
jgi:hypothetical protein